MRTIVRCRSGSAVGHAKICQSCKHLQGQENLLAMGSGALGLWVQAQVLWDAGSLA